MKLLSNSAANTALWGAMGFTRLGPWRRLLRAAQTPRRAQEDVLLRIISANMHTDFGQGCGFDKIRSIDAYRRAVSIQDYETLRPYVERQQESGAPSLTAEPPVFYQRTSGTLGAPKDIPLTQSGIARIHRFQRLSAFAQFRGSNTFQGRILGIGSPAVEGYLQCGKPYGSASGLIYESQPRAIASKFVLPAEVLGVADYDARYYVIAALGMAEPMVTSVATANPSTLVRLLDLINLQIDQLLSDIERGRLSVLDRLTPSQRAAVDGAFKGSPKRTKVLGDLMSRQGRLSFSDLWPQLGSIVTWTGGSCHVPLANLEGKYPGHTKVIEVGYAASEFRGTLNVDIARNLCLPTLTDHFFEFVRRDNWEQGTHNFVCLDELEEGESYYVFVTTSDGLYRYNMNDIVVVTGWINATPTLAFVQKGKGATNITGEKIYESQIIQAVDTAYRTMPRFFVALADEPRAQYLLYLEPSPTDLLADETPSAAIDTALRRLSVEYDAKRASDRLKPLRLHPLKPGTGDAYRRDYVSRGQRDAQFKVMHLQYARECDFDFEGHLEERLQR